ncbi:MULTISPECIES: Tox-REase-5 domain-containing protein [Streptomyces]|nr:Tox-REase-5 domain-containing protein [Streptomyces pini]
MSGLVSSAPSDHGHAGRTPMPSAVVAARLVLFVLLGLSVADAADGAAGRAVAYALVPGVPGVAGALLAGRMRSAGRPAWAGVHLVQAWVLVQAWQNTRDGLWWGPVHLVLPLLVVALLSTPRARSWFALARERRAPRRPVSPARMLGLRYSEGGQTSTEYVGMVVVVVAIVGGLVAAGVTTELGQSIGAKICRVVGGECGSAGEQPVAGGPGDADPTGGPGEDGGYSGDDPDADQAAADEPYSEGELPDSPEDTEYQEALEQVQDLEEALKGDKEKAKEAAEELAKILAEELGITDALDCITEGDGAACTETLINVLTSLIGGAVGKLAAKYGAPWKWKKAVELVKKIKKHGGDLYDGLEGIIDKSGKLKKARQRLRKAEDACDHSFLPGTPVLLADGSRRAIEEVRAGDLVTVTDPYRGLTTVRPVAGTITTEDDKDFTRLTVLVGGRASTLTATDTHPFWLVDEARWAEAGEIRPGDELRTPRGSSLRVTGVERYERQQRTHDLSVQDIHTYYVEVGDAAALVHNCPAGKPGTAKPGTAKPGDYKKWPKPSWYKDLKNPRRGSKDKGDGAWGSRKRAANSEAAERWIRYQEQVSGVKRGKEYLVKNPKGGRDVEFDGWDSQRQTYLEAKFGYGKYVKDGELPQDVRDRWVKQAQTQVNAAGGRPVEWHFSNKSAAEAAQEAFEDAGINVKVVHTPVRK